MSTTCRLCGHPLFPEPLLVQHAMPAAAQGLPTAEQLADDQGVTLALHQCAGCATVQLANPPVPYWREVLSLSKRDAPFGNGFSRLSKRFGKQRQKSAIEN